MELEHRLGSLKHTIEHACENEIRFVEKLAISSDCSSYEHMLTNRQKDKQKVLQLF